MRRCSHPSGRASEVVAGPVFGGLTAAVVLAINTAAAWYTKSGCPDLAHGHQLKPACYSDIEYLWRARHLSQHLFPYVHGSYQYISGIVFTGTGAVATGKYVVLHHGVIEYPVVIGVFAWLAGSFAHSASGFLVANVVLSIPVLAATVHVLWRCCGRRTWMLIASPAIAFYAFLNWDLLALVTAAVGVWLWSRRHPHAAVAVLAVGAFTKVWPAFFIVPICLELGSRGHWRRAASALATAVGTAAVLNVPFMLVDFRGWYAPCAFQAAEPLSRGVNSFWCWIAPTLAAATVDEISWVLFLAGFAIAAWIGWRRAATDGTYPVIQVGAVAVLWFTLVGKVFSPQYDLWVLLCFVLLRLSWRLWLAFTLADALVYTAWFGHPFHGNALLVPVLVRIGVVAYAMFRALGADAAVSSPEGPPDRSSRTAGRAEAHQVRVAPSAGAPLATARISSVRWCPGQGARPRGRAAPPG